MLAATQSLVAGQVALEMKPSFTRSVLRLATLLGVTAELFWRRIAFQLKLFIGAIFLMIAGVGPDFPVVGLFVALSGFGVGENLVLDTTVFSEFLPARN